MHVSHVAVVSRIAPLSRCIAVDPPSDLQLHHYLRVISTEAANSFCIRSVLCASIRVVQFAGRGAVWGRLSCSSWNCRLATSPISFCGWC